LLARGGQAGEEVNGFVKGEAARHGRASGRAPLGLQGVNVKGKVNALRQGGNDLFTLLVPRVAFETPLLQIAIIEGADAAVRFFNHLLF